MGVPTLVSVGTGSNGSGNVASPTTLSPGLPATRVNGDMLIAFTACTTNAATATCSTTGWSQVANVSLTNGRIYLFACDVDGTETGPSIVWSGMTTGVSGTPVLSSIACFRSLLNPVVVDVQGSTSDQAANASLAAGGGSAAATDVNSLLLTLSVRADDVGTWLTLRPNGGLVWQPVDTQSTTSGADAAIHWQWSVTGNPITVPAQTFTLTGGTSVVSSGVQVALTESQGTSTLAPSPYFEQVIADNPVGYWRFQDPAVARDSVGIHHGSYVGTPTISTTSPISDTGARSIALSGTGQYVDIPDAADLRFTSQFTLEAWINPTDRSGNYPWIGKWAANVGYIMWLTTGTGNVLYLFDGASTDYANPPATTAWTHMAFTFNNGSGVLYENGSAVNTLSTTAPSTGTTDLMIGNYVGATPFKGSIAEPAVYNKALPADRILAHYNAR